MLYTFLTWIAAGLVLAAFPVAAAPPLGCLENAKGQRLCEGFPLRFNPNPVRDQPKAEAWVHPATINATPRLYQPAGQQVASLPVDEFLPWYRARSYEDAVPWVGVLTAPAPVVSGTKK